MAVLRIAIFGLLLRDVFCGFCTTSYRCETACAKTQKYYVSCGLWGWSRCGKYSTVYESCRGTCYSRQCCTGYTGTYCNKPTCYGSTTCPNGGTCVSPDNCVCLPGFFSPFCTDIDECSGTSHGCQHTCINNAGSYTCTCRAGYVRNSDLKTCTEDCGHPGKITDGTVSVTSTLLGGLASYTCNRGYGLATGDPVRTCQSNFSWSGEEPTCLFANYCESAPCLNGATCVNLIGSMRCDCAQGWEGQFCEIDIEPPAMTGCNDDIHVNATEKTVLYRWSEPVFSDNRGSEIEIVSNYPTPEFTFPWGNFTVQYVATKTANGLSTECTFQIIVRPTPCEPLNVPENGALVCNGWQRDYGQFCMIMCRQNFTIGPSYSYGTWYVCGASGKWIVTSPVPNCKVPVDSEMDGLYYHEDYASYVYTSCEDQDTRTRMQNLYLETLSATAGFSSFCSTYNNECIKENVAVHC